MTTIVDWLGSGLDADLPTAATIDALLVSGAAARYYAYDTGIDYVLNRDTVAWDAIGGVGGSGTVAGSSGDIQINSSGSFGALTPGSGIATFLATPSSANLRSALTDEVGTGAAYFVGGALGTPASGTATNLTSIPVAQATGVLPAANGGAGTVSGVLKANGSGTVSAASAGTDYAAATGGSSNTPLFDNGSGGFTNGTRSGNTTAVATVTGSLTSGHIAAFDASGNIVDGGIATSGVGGGDVVGPGSATASDLVLFDGTTGKLLKDGGSLIAPAAGFTVTFGMGGFTFALANDLAALEGMGGTGLVARTASETYAQRTITGTANRISLSNGDGVAGNPTIDIDAAYVGQSSITTLGTIGTGTWAGTTVTADHGGTGNASYTQGDILYASAGTTISKLAKNTSATRYLSNTGASNNPAWAQVDLTNGVTGVLPIANGGTGASAPPFNILLPIAGVTTNGELLVPGTIIPACSFPSGASGSYGSASVAATGSTTITAKKNGSAFATFVWAGAGTAATVTIGSTTSFNGTTDKLTIEAPATADATLADIGLNLAGTRS